MKYDVIVIGSGVAGSTAAYRLNTAGKKTAVVDKGPWGGTCANMGCDPKKVLYTAAKTVQHSINVPGVTAATIDWQHLINYKETFTKHIPEETKKEFRESGIDIYEGKASFRDENTIEIRGKRISAGNIIIATGAKPRELGIPGEDNVITSRQFMMLGSLPKKIVFIGGGYISFEFAHIAKRAGADVTILNRSSRLLDNFDKNIVDDLEKISKSQGIKIHKNKEVTEVKKDIVVTKDNTAYEADLVVHGAGRIPELDLDLKSGNIERDMHGILVDDNMQSKSNKQVYAAGDAASAGMPLTPVGIYQARVAVDNILGKESRADYEGVPSVVFTVPPLASVGISEESAKDGYSVIYKDRSEWFSTKSLNYKYASSKILIKDNQIIGAHILGPGAYEAINLFALAMRNSLSVDQVMDTVYAYPTISSEIRYMLG